MKLLLASVLLLTAGYAHAASIPVNLEFTHMSVAPAGTKYRMTDHPNSVFVFEVFLNSCPDCNKNAPAVNRLAADYANNPRVQVLDTGLDSNAAFYQAWIKNTKPNHQVINDSGYQVFNLLSTANTIPQVFIVNCKGEMVANHVDVWDANAEKEIRGYINTALQTTCTKFEE